MRQWVAFSQLAQKPNDVFAVDALVIIDNSAANLREI
ncbi:hypothetical protein VCSRO77_2506 [Vibrio cholerae]|nr:hypothetical protein DA89_3653 [Vibrio cholerae]BCK29124.1 hypothetical protein VCSRO77_2506 [Vibrio cholerae]